MKAPNQIATTINLLLPRCCRTHAVQRAILILVGSLPLLATDARGADIEKKVANGYLIKSWRDDDGSRSHIQFIAQKTGKAVFESSDPVQPYMGDGCISSDGRFLAYVSGGASVGHMTTVLKLDAKGAWQPVVFDFEDAYVRHAVKTGVLKEPGQITHLYSKPLRFNGHILLIQFLGDYALHGKQPSLPGTKFTFDPVTKSFDPVAKP